MTDLYRSEGSGISSRDFPAVVPYGNAEISIEREDQIWAYSQTDSRS